jgi:hypothetical protein
VDVRFIAYNKNPDNNTQSTHTTDFHDRLREAGHTQCHTHKKIAPTLARCLHHRRVAGKGLLHLGEALVSNRISKEGQVQVPMQNLEMEMSAPGAVGLARLGPWGPRHGEGAAASLLTRCA